MAEFSEDWCTDCCSKLASVTPPCGHRQLCETCHYGKINRASPRVPVCPIPTCRRPITGATSTLELQLRTTTLSDAENIAEALKSTYPYGCKLFEKEGGLLPANAETIRTVREAMLAVNASKLTHQALVAQLRTRLTQADLCIVYVELAKEVDLHKVLTLVGEKLGSVETVVKTFLARSIQDTTAVLSRAAVGTAIDTAFTAVTHGITGLSKFNVKVDVVSNAVVGSIFAGIEIYRWATSKKMTLATLATNVGEHVVGLTCAVGGAKAGAMGGLLAGAAAGSAVPIVGTVIGGIVGSILGMIIGGTIADASGRYVYRKILPGEDVSWEAIEAMSPKAIAQNAATKFGVNLDTHNRTEARARFHKKLLASHPDKHPGLSDEETKQKEEEFRDILACWTIVRLYYIDNPPADEVAESDAEGYISAWMYRVRDSITAPWKVKRSWFGELSDLGRDNLNPDLEEACEVVICV